MCSISTLVRIVHINNNERNIRLGRIPNWWQSCQLINTVVTESELKGLYLNSTKSFTMVFSKAKVNPACSVSVHGNVLGQVQSFVYLGSLYSHQMQEVIRRSGEELRLQNPPLH